MNKLLPITLALSLFSFSAFAAVTPNNVITAQTPKNAVVQFLQGTDTALTYKTAYTAGTNGSKITALWMDNNDASATHVVTCQIVNTAIKYGGVALLSVINAGFATAVPPQSLLTPSVWAGLPIDGNGNPYMYLNSGDTLQCTFATALTASDQIDIHVTASDF